MRVLAAILCLLLMPGVVRSGGKPDPVPGRGGREGGRFTVFTKGKQAGVEVCEFRTTDAGLTLSSRLTLTVHARRHELSLDILLDPKSHAIRSFRAVGVTGDRQRVVALKRSGAFLVGTSEEGDKKEELSLPASDRTVILSEPFAAPYLLLHSGVRGPIPVLDPLHGRSGKATIEDRGQEALEIDGAARIARRLLVRSDPGETANLWMDESGRLLVCARPVAGISAVRGRAFQIGLKPGEDPPDPPGVRSHRVRFAGPGITLAGTFCRPVEGVVPLPAILLLSGSGPQDRNGNVPNTELQWNTLTSIAHELARRGIASFRYDERGVGHSAGRFYEAGLSDLTADARSALRYLGRRGDIDRARMGVIGHSEGALIGAQLAADPDPRLRALLLMGAPFDPLDKILLWQVERRMARRGEGKRETQRVLGDMRALFEHIRLSRHAIVHFRGRTRAAHWLREHMAVTPGKLYAAVRCPTRVLHGALDLQVPSTAAVRTGKALGKFGAGVTILPGLDHFLISGTGRLSDYAETDRRVEPGALRLIGDWLRKRLQ